MTLPNPSVVSIGWDGLPPEDDLAVVEVASGLARSNRLERLDGFADSHSRCMQ